MPIETNFANEALVYHLSLPINGVNPTCLELLQKNKPKDVSLRFMDTCLELRSEKTCVHSWNEAFLQALGNVIRALGQPWWDFTLLVTDNWEYVDKIGHQVDCANRTAAHALTLLRVYPDGDYSYLVG